MAIKVLITGGLGMIGSRLQQYFQHSLMPYHILSRKPSLQNHFLWDINKNYIDVKAFDGVNTIVHLAGTNIGLKRWTKSFKKEILDSRVKSTQLLNKTLLNNPNTIKHIIAASAIGYYGKNIEMQNEESKKGYGFLSDICEQWNFETQQLALKNNLSYTQLRFSAVLSPNKGIIKKLHAPLAFGIGFLPFKGQPAFPYVHIDDVCRAIIHIINQHPTGIYNLCHPVSLTYKEAIEKLAKNKPYIPIHIPSFIMRLALGEMSQLIENTSPICSKKLLQSGFEYKFSLEDALTMQKIRI